VRYEPAINREKLVATLRTEYGLAVHELTFVPVGYVAACYAVRCARDRRYFLKLWPDTPVGSVAAAGRESSLRLTHALYERRLYQRLPYPIPTRQGSLSATFEGSLLAVFPFLPGHPVPRWSELPGPTRDEFARTLAAIHGATPALTDVLPARETFDLRDESDLHAGLIAIEQIGPRARPGLQALRELVLPRRAEILAQVDRLHRLQDTVRRLPGPLVLCHTDLTGDNLLVDDHDQLSVLDWDDATVAPPEHDLQSALGEGFDRFLKVYAAAGGVGPWHLDHFAFYLLRRHLGDMTVRLQRSLTDETTDLEDAALLQGIEEWGFARWRALDQTLDGVERALRSI